MLGRLFGRDPHAAADELIRQGNLAEKEGRLSEACELYRQAVACAPRYAKAHVNLGIGLEAAGDRAGAVACHEKALGLDPADPYANYNLGRLRFAAGELVEAGTLLARALESRPQFADARVIYGCVLASQGNAEAAISQFESALQERPRDFAALYHQAAALRRLGRLQEARNVLQRAIALQPDSTDAHAALFDVLTALGDAKCAAVELEILLRARPHWADALYNYGCLLRNQLRLDEAEDAFRRALAADPGHAPSYRMLGGVLLAQCRPDEALELYRLARERCPDDAQIQSAELFALCGSDRISDADLFAAHVAYGRRLEQAHAPLGRPFRGSRHPERRLRVGYLSGDFCYHVVTLFMLPVLERHDRAAFEVYCYSTGEAADEYTRRVASHADRWRHSPGMSETDLANRIADDEIDILVDLAGHSGVSQLSVMARRPAPVQATWLGYLGTTGLSRIQYRISDRFADPPGLTDRFHTERLIRLPHSQWCYRPFLSIDIAPAGPHARHGYVTFGAFHQAMKLSVQVRGLWARILAELPDSRLVLVGAPQGRALDALRRDLGVASERLTILPYVSLHDYLQRFNEVDIGLDAAPYSGGTTTCDSLWMGVPVITAPGSRSVSRSATSVLSSVGLTEWIAPSEEEYVRRAVAFARQPDRLAELRSSLRDRMRSSPLMDEAGFTRDLESAYRGMWRAWCSSGT